MAKIYLGKESPTPTAIAEAVDSIASMPKFEGKIDKEKVTRIIQSHYTINIGEMEILEDKTDHEEWINKTLRKPIDSSFEWKAWHNYKVYLQEEKFWPPNVIESVDKLSTEIISRIEKDIGIEEGWSWAVFNLVKLPTTWPLLLRLSTPATS